MIKFIKDVIFGEPIVAITIISLVLTAWLGALSQIGDPVPLWLAIAAPAAVLLGGFYAKQVTAPTRPDQVDHDHDEDPPLPPLGITVTEPLRAEDESPPED